MTFSDTVRAELCDEQLKSACCRRALLFGMLAARAYPMPTGDGISLNIRDSRVAALARHLISEQLGREANERRRTDAVAASALLFSSRVAHEFLTALESGTLTLPEKCQNCRRLFLRGLFLGAGRVSITQGNCLLELSLGDRRPAMLEFLRGFELAPKSVDRRKEKLLYFRQSGAIEDFLALIGANHAVFTLMDQKIAAGIRNDANRAANCDANNIDKSTSAAHRQIALIRRLIEENKLSSLPPELADTARTRIEYEALSLGQLAAIHRPPLTKSGLNHRLARIMELAEGLLD